MVWESRGSGRGRYTAGRQEEYNESLACTRMQLCKKHKQVCWYVLSKGFSVSLPLSLLTSTRTTCEIRSSAFSAHTTATIAAFIGLIEGLNAQFS